MLHQLVQIMLPGVAVSITTFILVEAMIYKNDRSNISGFVTAGVLAILFGAITDVVILLIIT